MPTCTFFGHHDCPDSVKPILREVLIDLIEHRNVTQFYVGNKGRFDYLVRAALRELSQEYPHIRYAVVLERLPSAHREFDPEDYSDTLVPEGIENALPRFAISWRNRWMLRQSDFVVAYVTRSFGGAAQFTEMAEKQGKTVIHLAHLS